VGLKDLTSEAYTMNSTHIAFLRVNVNCMVLPFAVK